MAITIEQIPSNLRDTLLHGREETYLEYKGDVPWTDRAKKLEIVKTIFALANERNGGIIVIGVKDDGRVVGLSNTNYQSYSHDSLNQYLSGRTNQEIGCKLARYEYTDGVDEVRVVFIQVSECREFPLVHVGSTETINLAEGAYPENIGIRNGALYIRNRREVENKEIKTTAEWQEMIERTYRKYERETMRRLSVVAPADPYVGELTI